MLFFVTACLLPAFCISWLATAAMRRLAPRIGLVDHPAARKVHVTPTPLGGGIAIWLGVVLPLGLAFLVVRYLAASETLPEWIPQQLSVHFDGVLYRSRLLFGILAGGTVLSLMGLYDDLRGLPWWLRLGVQWAVAAGMVLCGVQATVFVPVPWVGMLLTALWIVVLINSLNFLDNMDGLTSGISLIAASLFATVMLTSLGEPRWLVAGVLLVLAGAVAGFLWHNWPPARIFMGDAGSTFIGLILSTMTVLGTFYEPSQSSRHTILAPLCVLAVPLYDFCSVMVIRLKQGRSPFQADKSHFSHRLVELGLSPRHAVLTIHLATLTTGLGAILLYELPGWSSALIVLGLIVCVLGIVAILETAGRRRGERR